MRETLTLTLSHKWARGLYGVKHGLIIPSPSREKVPVRADEGDPHPSPLPQVGEGIVWSEARTNNPFSLKGEGARKGG